jgi:carbonic anhydrase
MRQLIDGICAFQQDVFPSIRRRFEKLVTGQQPRTLFITCSDSRIVPHLLTQSGPGELFVLRVAGNLVPPATAPPTGEAATIEYAVTVLKVSDLVVCGHSHCGAISALFSPDTLEQLPAMKQWLAHANATAREFVDASGGGVPDSDLITAAIQHNVVTQLAHLRTYPVVAEAESRGELSLHGWFYRFETGETLQLNDSSQTFVSIMTSAADSRSVV